MTALSFWGHALAALAFGLLCGWQLQRPGASRSRYITAGAFAATAWWSIVILLGGAPTIASRLAETLRDFAWLGLLAALFAESGAVEAQRRTMVGAIYGVVAAILIVEMVVDIMPVALDPVYADDFVLPSRLLRMTFAIGALLLVHNLYSACSAETRWGYGPPLAALGILWVYDLNLYTVAVLIGRPPLLFALRGGLNAAIAPLFATAILRGAGFRIRPSRAATFRSLTLLAAAGYILAMIAAARLLRLAHGEHASLAEFALPLLATLFALVLLPSRRLRAWARVKIAKHLFEHRYDYRVEWLRFTDTLGRSDAAAPLAQRVVKAIADITESPAGLLLEPDATGGLAPTSAWNWAALEAPARAADASLADHLAQTGWIIEFDALRAGREAGPVAVPTWLLAEPAIWAAAPLVHGDRLVGVVLVARPVADRSLDWEDFDLLRAAGRQVASYLAEARAAEALADGRRFEEFNRRFAFVAHDIKNLASQIGLVARNAERHADNPEFRADMIATLNASASKMHALLARLSLHNHAKAEPIRAIDLDRLVRGWAKAWRLRHPIEVTGRGGRASADPARLEQALTHLVQNAIDASPAEAPVRVMFADAGPEGVRIQVADDGAGMSHEFIRTGLFRPFASTKPDGFGVGAFEARNLIEGMGGRLEVESRPGHGSCFTVHLPPAAAAPAELKEVA